MENNRTISERVKILNLPLGKYVVVGGAMEAHGIRPANDIDIVVTEDLFEELIRKGWRVCECEKCRDRWKRGSQERILKSDGVDILSEYTWEDKYHADTGELIRDAEIIGGVPYVQLGELLKWKKAANREKDQKDVKLIEKFLQQREEI